LVISVTCRNKNGFLFYEKTGYDVLTADTYTIKTAQRRLSALVEEAATRGQCDSRCKTALTVANHKLAWRECNKGKSGLARMNANFE
jgi:hypothetical protein